MNPETKTTFNIEQAVPFFWVTDIDASFKYYVDRLGFQITNKWIDGGKLRWCWLQRDRAAPKGE